MTDLVRYDIRYQLNGSPRCLTLESFAPPSLEQAQLHILLSHVGEPRPSEDAPWETPIQPSLETRLQELGVADVYIEAAD
jgi:hypothetical protein